MFKRLVCSTLMFCASGAYAGDWQKEFFSSISNELPASRGVAVDELGNLHLQAFNKQPWSTGYDLAHQYTINAQGQIPWIWGLSQVDRMSDCGVYAKSGQRLDCFEIAGFNGDQTRLEMRSRYGSQIVWQTVLPGEVKLLDASIPIENTALFVGKLSSARGDELGVFRSNSSAPAEVLSVVGACQQPGQTMTASRFRMPKQPEETIRHMKACWNSFGTTDLILEEFDLATGQWNTLSMWSVRFGADIAHMAINAEGNAFVLTEDGAGFRELLTNHLFGGQWQPQPFPIQGKIDSFLLSDRELVIVSRAPDMKSYGPNTVSWFDLQGPFWPNTRPFAALGQYTAQGFALSSNGELIAVGYRPFHRSRVEIVLLASRQGALTMIGGMPLAVNESTLGKPHVIGGPNNVAIVARTVSKYDSLGSQQIGVRTNQYNLPMSP